MAASLTAGCSQYTLQTSQFAGDCRPLTASTPSVQSRPTSLRIVSKESRIGKMPVTLPKGVTIKLEGQSLKVKGPLGELSQNYPGEISLTAEGEVITVARAMETRRAREMHGLFR